MNVGDKVSFELNGASPTSGIVLKLLDKDSALVAVVGYGILTRARSVLRVTHTASYKTVHEFKPGQVWNDDNESTYFVVRNIGNDILMVNVHGELNPLGRFDPDTEWILVHDV